MATTLYQGNAGVMDTKAYANLFDKSFEDIRMIQDRVPKQGLQFVAEKDTTLETPKFGETTSELNLPFVSTDTEKIRFVTPAIGHSKSFTVVQRRAGIIVTRTAVETQVFKEIVAMMKGLPMAADRVVEYSIAALFDGGAATYTGADGSYLFAADHTHEDTQVAAWSNVLTSATFSTTAYNLAWQNLQNRVSSKGYVNPYDADSVVYPVALHEKVCQVLGSPKVAENANNGINVFAGDAKPIKYNYLSSSTKWYVHGKRPGDTQDDEGFWLIWRVRPNYMAVSDSTNPDLIYGQRLRMALVVGGMHARNWAYNAGA